MADTFCCLTCRLLQGPAQVCVECGAPTMSELSTGADVLKYRSLDMTGKPATAGGWVKQVAATLGIGGGYVGLFVAGFFWVPGVPIILGAGAGAGALAAWRYRRVPIIEVPVVEPRVGEGAITVRGVARKLGEAPRSVVDGAPILAEEVRVMRRGGVLLRRITSAPFLIGDTDEKVVVAGVVRVVSRPAKLRLKKGEPLAAALGVPAEIPLAGDVEHARIADGDVVTATAVESTEMVPELAFHRDAGEARVMRGGVGSVVMLSLEPKA